MDILTLRSKCMKPRSCINLRASKTCFRILTASNSGRESPSIRANKSPPLALNKQRKQLHYDNKHCINKQQTVRITIQSWHKKKNPVTEAASRSWKLVPGVKRGKTCHRLQAREILSPVPSARKFVTVANVKPKTM